MPTNKHTKKRKREEQTEQLANPDQAFDQNQLPVDELDEPGSKKIKVNGYEVNVFAEDNEEQMRLAAQKYNESRVQNFNPNMAGLKRLGYRGERAGLMCKRIKQLHQAATDLLGRVHQGNAALTVMQIKLDEASVDEIKQCLDATCDYLVALNAQIERLIGDISALTADKSLPESVKQILQNLMDQITTMPLENSINDFVNCIPEASRPLISELSPSSQQLLPQIVPEIYSLPRFVMVR